MTNKETTLTYIVQVGNSDDKLTQSAWAHFVNRINSKVRFYAHNVHFSGGSDWDAPWQNACWVFEMRPSVETALVDELRMCREEFGQDAVALTCGATCFV